MLARISITVPRPLVAAADRRAKELDRSRSWVVAEALRRYLAAGPTPDPETAVRALREPTVAPYAAAPTTGLGSYRRAQLEADLVLTPTERVREAERTARVTELTARGRRGDRVLTFDHYEDYLEWKRRDDLTPL